MMISKKENRNGTVALFLASLFWGMSFAFIRDAVSTINPMSFIFWRFLFASLVLYIFFYKKIKFSRKTLEHGFLLGFFLSGVIIFQTIGLFYTTAATTAFITGFAVVLVALFEVSFGKQWPSIYLLASVVLAVVGIGIITLGKGLAINQGDIWVLLSTFFSAGYILFVGKASKSGEAFSLTFIQSVFLCIVAGGIAFFTTGINKPQHINVWVAIIFCAIFASFLAFYLQLHYQKYVSANKAANIFALEPVFGAIMAALYLHERLNLQFYFGAVLIFIAVFLAEKHSRRKILPQA